MRNDTCWRRRFSFPYRGRSGLFEPLLNITEKREKMPPLLVSIRERLFFDRQVIDLTYIRPRIYTTDV